MIDKKVKPFVGIVECFGNSFGEVVLPADVVLWMTVVESMNIVDVIVKMSDNSREVVWFPF